MSLPPQLQAKYLARFDELIAEGESLHKSIRQLPGDVTAWDGFSGQVLGRGPTKHVVDWPSFVEWKTSCIALVSQVLIAGSALGKSVETFQHIKNDGSNLEWGIATLKAVREDFEKGFIGDLLIQVETEIASDYMGQAEGLLREGQPGKHDHVPAAVLAGAVLEKALRTMCAQQQPPISTLKADGEPKTLNPKIDDLKKADVFNEMKAKQLRVWAAIRNHAAHGEFDKFKRSDVELMIPGINNFLADFLK